MSFIVENKVLWRKIALALFILAMLGPWAYELLNVPAQYPCDKPSVRLQGDFCGYPMSGFEAFRWTAGGSFFVLMDLIQGNRVVRIRELVFLMSMWIIILPFVSMPLLIWNKDSRRLQTINLIAWALACLLALAILIPQTNQDQPAQIFSLFWGVWIYILVAIGSIIFEILAVRSNVTPGTAMDLR